MNVQPVHQIKQYPFLPERLQHKVEYAKVIGEGSFGQVYFLRNKKNQNGISINNDRASSSSSSAIEYVLKRVRIHNLENQQQAEAVEEALILSRLHHTNICELYDFFLDGEFL